MQKVYQSLFVRLSYLIEHSRSQHSRSQYYFLALHAGGRIHHTALLALGHSAHARNLRSCSEHLVVALLPVDELELVELHIVLLLLYECIFLSDLLVEVLDHLNIFWTRRTAFV